MVTARILRCLRILPVLVVILLVIYIEPHTFLWQDNPAPEAHNAVVMETPVDTRRPLGTHNYRSDGLLEVNPDGPHPIFELMEEAERRWKEKLHRASSSLDEAVQEYRRRYRRDPPKGFDHWWDYVQLHNVQLPDEYDQIYHDLEPFLGLKPAELSKIREDLEAHMDSFTLGKTELTQIEVVNTSFREGKYDDLIRRSVSIIDLLQDIEDFLPPFRAVFSPHDGPNRLTDHGVRAATVDAARRHIYIERSSLPKINQRGWASPCAPSNPLSKLYPFNLDEPPPSKPNKAFIYDHLLAMDPCLHPDHLWHHGQFLSHNNGPTPQHTMVPQFSHCSTTLHYDIRIPTPYGWVEDIPRSDDPEWDDKIDERLLWRGTNTGIFHADHTRWQTSQRDALVANVNDLNGTIDILPPIHSRFEPVGNARTVRKARLNPAIFDIAFAGSPTACSPNVCKRLENIYPWRQRQSVKDAGNYKYVFDVDGNGWSGRFKRLITSNSVVFKSTIYPEWYTGRIAPWLHYIPVQLDLSDLHDALIFFRGDANGEGAHEDLARKVALAGRDWSKRLWRREDLVAYFFRLMLEYTRLMSVDRDAMTFKGDGFRD